MKIKNYIIGLSIIVSSIIISISMVVANKSSNKNKIEEIKRKLKLIPSELV